MSEPENFLARWSRLKREGADSADRAKLDNEDGSPAVEADAVAPIKSDETVSAEGAPEPPPFDLGSLPSIESITATTDIRPFLAPGVPTALRTAALRRVWVADPGIRDFIEIAENQWDFSVPDNVPGFASFKPGDDVGRYIAQLSQVKETPAKNASASTDVDAEPLPATESVQHGALVDLSAPSQTDASASMMRCSEEDVASQEETEVQRAAVSARRNHGRALPQ